MDAAKSIIGVFGSGSVVEADREWQAAFSVGRLLAERGCIVLTGGLGGAMTAASRGAREAGGTTVGILPGSRETGPANPYVDIPLYTGMGQARNVINAKSCRAAIAVGGEYGTLSEIALALKAGIPVILLDSWSLTAPGGGTPAQLSVARTPREAVDLALAKMPKR